MPVMCKGERLTERSKSMKHKVIFNVTNDKDDKTKVLRGAQMWLPRRLIKWLFGEYTQVYLLDTGKIVESVDVKEIMKG